MKFLHTSDIHLEAKFEVLGEKANEQREQIKTTFSKIVDLALQRDVALLLIAGDLFDSNNPSSSAIDFVIRELKRLTDQNVKVCIIPGNHDYALSDRRGLGKIFSGHEREGLFLFSDPDGAKVQFKELNTEVYAKANTTNKSSKSPIVFVDNDFDGCKIIMAHGGVMGQAKKPQWPIQPRDIEKCGATYIALGDWHSLREESRGSVVAYYSGSPEMISFSQGGAGNVIIGQYTDGHVSIEPVRVGKRFLEELLIHAGDIINQDDFKKRLLEKANKDLALIVKVQGFSSADKKIDFFSLEKELSQYFWRLKIINETHKIQTEEVAYPSVLASGQLINILNEKIKIASSDAERGVYEQALKLGLAALNNPDAIV